MARKKATTKKKKAAEPVVEEIDAVEEEPTIEEKEGYKIKFDSAMEDREFYEPGVRYEKKDGRTEKIDVIKPIRIRAGETKIITKEQLDYLMSKNLLLTSERKEDIDKTKRRLLNLRSGREGPKEEMQVISDEDKVKIFVDLPYLIEDEE